MSKSPRFSLDQLPAAYHLQVSEALGYPRKAVSADSTGKPAIGVSERTPLDRQSPTIAWFVTNGLPAPVAEYQFHPTRKWRMDWAWPDYKVCLEVDGSIWTQGRHTRGSGWIKDTEKLNTAACLGWRLLRVQPADLHKESTIELIKRTLLHE